ncbi:MAG: hypothetical protein ABSB28_11235 [Candidatus Bathyarchaeia archaeon]
MSEKTRKQEVENKETDLVKIQIYADKCHTFLTLGCSLGFVLLGLWGVFAAVYYQGLSTFNFPFVYAGWVGMGGIGTIAVVAVWIFVSTYRREFRRISKMVEAVKKGESQLPDLDKLYKWDC